MRVRILSCVSLVDLVLVRYIGGEGGGDGRGGRRPCGMGAFIFGQHCADPRLLAHAMYLISVQGWGGGDGGGTDDVHAIAAYMYCFPLCTVHWWEGCALVGRGGGGKGGMLMMLMLFCMMLIAYAEDNKGDDDTYGDSNALVVTLLLRRHQYKNTRAS